MAGPVGPGGGVSWLQRGGSSGCKAVAAEVVSPDRRAFVTADRDLARSLRPARNVAVGASSGACWCDEERQLSRSEFHLLAGCLAP